MERLSEALRKRDYVPIVFNFDKPETKDFTETVRLLAGLSKFVIADIPDEAYATVLLMSLGKLGNVRTQTLRAFTAAELAPILSKVD